VDQLSDALANDFEGHDDLRRMLLSVPKFGNDEDYRQSSGPREESIMLNCFQG